MFMPKIIVNVPERIKVGVAQGPRIAVFANADEAHLSARECMTEHFINFSDLLHRKNIVDITLQMTASNDCNCQLKSRFPPNYDKLICNNCGRKFEDK